jgi:short-subunit dehydrogenase
MSVDSSKKNIIITGGSGGIGRATALLLVKNQCNVMIVSRDEKNLTSAIEFLMPYRVNNNQQIISYSADVTNFDEMG